MNYMADDDEEQEEEWFCKFCMEQKLPRKKLCTEDDITFAEDPTSVVYRTI